MKTLSLLRHGEAPQSLEGDLYRELGARGIQSLENLSAQLATEKCFFDYILCSPVKRAKDSMNIILRHQISNPKIIFNEDLYSYSGDDLDQFISNIGNHYNNALIVGHNPLISRLAYDITTELNSIIFSPAMYIKFSLNINDWSQYHSKIGKVLTTTPPNYEKR